jgi:hypothetical protein
MDKLKPTESKLKELALANESNLDRVLSPNWDFQGWDYWTAHIPDDLRSLWPKLSIESKLVAYLLASKSAMEIDFKE